MCGIQFRQKIQVILGVLSTRPGLERDPHPAALCLWPSSPWEPQRHPVFDPRPLCRQRRQRSAQVGRWSAGSSERLREVQRGAARVGGPLTCPCSPCFPSGSEG